MGTWSPAFKKCVHWLSDLSLCTMTTNDQHSPIYGVRPCILYLIIKCPPIVINTIVYLLWVNADASLRLNTSKFNAVHQYSLLESPFEVIYHIIPPMHCQCNYTSLHDFIPYCLPYHVLVTHASPCLYQSNLIWIVGLNLALGTL